MSFVNRSPDGACGEVAASCVLQTLGTFAFSLGGRHVEGPVTLRARALLTYLALQRGRDLARERLVDIFWPEAEPERGRDSLNTALSSLRRTIRAAGCDPDRVFRANKAVVHWTAGVQVDVETLAGAARSADVHPLASVLAIYRGEFLEGDFHDWTVAQRERSGADYETLLSSAVEHSGDADAARHLIARNPYDERAYRVLVRAALAAGRMREAAEAVRACRRALAELGVAPSAQFDAEVTAAEVATPPATRGRGEGLDRLLVAYALALAPEASPAALPDARALAELLVMAARSNLHALGIGVAAGEQATSDGITERLAATLLQRSRRERLLHALAHARTTEPVVSARDGWGYGELAAFAVAPAELRHASRAITNFVKG